MEKQIQIIKLLLETTLDKMTVEGEIDVIEDMDCPQFIIRTREAGILIGESGQNLLALNCLFKKMVESELRKQELDQIKFFLDVNNYQTKKIEELKNLARMSAQRVRYFKKEVEMNPMNSYERMIVHSVLTEYPDIKTESAGEDPNRRVVIKPYE